MTFLGIDLHGKDYLNQLNFFPFGLKNALSKFQKIMGQVLAVLVLPNVISMNYCF
jgi:hypothetical protein